MKPNKLFVLKALSGLPFVGRYAERKYYEELLLEVECIEARFFSTSVRFVDQIHDLYDCLKGAELSFEDDFAYFRELVVKMHSNSSLSLTTCLKGTLNGRLELLDDYFKSAGATRNTHFLHWHSNAVATAEFMNKAAVLTSVYCLRNPRQEDGEVFNVTQVGVQWTPALANFVGGSFFRLMIEDYISLLRVALDMKIRRLNG